MIAKFNSYMDFTVNEKEIEMKTELDFGIDFKIHLDYIKDNEASFKIEYIKDKKTNKVYKSRRFVKKYATWIFSILREAKKEGII